MDKVNTETSTPDLLREDLIKKDVCQAEFDDINSTYYVVSA